MRLDIEGTPKIERDSWLGKAIQLLGAKTWCSLVVRGIIALKVLAVYGFGWYLMFHFPGTESGFFAFMGSVLLVVATCGVTMVGSMFLIYSAVEGLKKFNCWAQNQCTPIFKDE